MQTNQLAAATIDGVSLRQYAEILLGIVAGWHGENVPSCSRMKI
jgi:hypothetical protein